MSYLFCPVYCLVFIFVLISQNQGLAKKSESPSSSLLKNSSMDDFGKDGIPSNWKDLSWGKSERIFTKQVDSSGNSYLQLHVNKLSGGWIRFGQKLAIKPGKVYQGSVRLKSDKPDAPFRLGVLSQASNGKDLVMENIAVDDTWNTYSFILDYVNPVEDIWIYFATNVKCDLCVDDFVLNEVTHLVSDQPSIKGNLIANGSFEGGLDYQWGTRYRASPYINEIKTLYQNPKVERVDGGPQGNYSVSIEMPARTRFYMRSIPFIANYGRTHQMRLFAKKVGGGVDVSLGVGSDKVELSALKSQFEPGDDWKEYSTAGKIKVNKRSQYYASVDIVSHEEPSTVFLDGISLVESEKPDFNERYSSTIYVNPKQEGCHLYFVNQPFAPDIEIYGLEGSIPSGTLQIGFTDVFGNESTVPPIDLKGGTKKIVVPLPVEKRPGKTGLFKAKISVISNDKTLIARPYEFIFEVIPDLTSKKSFEVPFGTHADPIPVDLDALWKLGFRWLRLHDASSVVSYSIIGKSSAKLDFADEVVDRLHDKGFKLLGLLNGEEDYMRQIMERYRGKIDAYEVFNEPFYYWLKTRTAKEYVNYLDSAFKLAHKNEAISVGICGSSHDRNWSSEVWKAGGMDHYDVFSFHGYVTEMVGGETDHLFQGCQFFKSETDKYGGSKARIWDTEGGSRYYASWYDDVQLEKPRLSHAYNIKHLVASYVMRQALGVEKFFVYTSHSSRFPSDTGSYCILEHDRSAPKPAAAAIPFLFDFIYGYQVTNSQLVDGVRYVEYTKIDDPKDIHIVAWSINEVKQALLNSDVELVDVMGNSHGKGKSLAFAEFPLFLKSTIKLTELIKAKG